MSQGSNPCCVCLKTSLTFEKINAEIYGDVKYIDKLRACVPNKCWEDIFSICQECVEKLDEAYRFVQLCLSSEKYRKQQIEQKEVTTNKVPSKDSGASNFTCYECNKSFRLKRTLSLHITRIHASIKKEEPTDADESDSITTVDEDLREVNDAVKDEVTDDNTKECSDFEEKYNNVEDYSVEDGLDKSKSHKSKKPGPKPKIPQKCQYCSCEFTRSERYIHHVRSKHTFEKPFQCSLCEAKYYSQHNLNIHMRKHRNERPFVCSTCGKCFTSSNDLWQHHKIHDNVRQYGCNLCGKDFKTHSNLRTHKMQMHQDPAKWKFVCTVCGKKFPLNNNLTKHMRRHEGIKDFLCHLCDKRFVERIDLQSHLLSHSNERHFKCGICSKEYKKKETLRRHMKIEHDLGTFVVKKPEKKLLCPMCPKVFAFNNKLQRHILTHTGEKPYKCEYCDKSFRDTYDRNCHLRQVHNIDPKSNSVMQL